MRVTVMMFAAAREIVNASTVIVETPPDATVGDLRTALTAAHPRLDPLINHALFAVGGQYVDDGEPLTESSEVACIPPVSGG